MLFRILRFLAVGENLRAFSEPLEPPNNTPGRFFLCPTYNIRFTKVSQAINLQISLPRTFVLHLRIPTRSKPMTDSGEELDVVCRLDLS